MPEEYVEPDPELEKKMKLDTSKGKVIELKKSSSKEDTGQKMGDIKEGVSEKKEDVKEKMGNAKQTMAEKKEDVSGKIEEVKEGASEKKEDIEKGMGEAKEEVEEQKEKLEKESEEEGKTPAEKILNDIVTRFRQGTDQINEAISGTESETTKTVEKPLVDVLETNDTIILVADISGVKKDDINIGISKNSVELTAMFKEEPEVEDAQFTIKERSYGETHRTIMLPKEINVKEATAKYKDCTLTLMLPKTVEDITKVNIED